MNPRRCPSTPPTAGAYTPENPGPFTPKGDSFLARYRGYLQADDYVGYHGLFRGRRVYHAACWAHARRGFFEIARKDATPGLAQQALDWIRQIYRVEREIRGRPPDERRRERQQRTRPLLDRFRQWLTGIERDLLPRGPMAIAVRYVLSNWRALLRFTRVGMLEADSNLVERCMRPVAVGRNKAKSALMRTAPSRSRRSVRRIAVSSG